ncbi:G-alpha-domain-containing protein [Wolfiporia cocos MD-104 SS10]|uniref:G-alpha-domain-containing protein n=1 Tax=Wolfiporia cocos (strain MD-104) TaxID=742152 RepID=A0A2H3JN15_WOLCO|nr:G-alpha-domain-containing protein [Wolfiporia cocos MD-104 SS10]
MSNNWPPYPPDNETELERALRLEEEREAKRVSDEIDRGLERERQNLRKKKIQTTILLLGQAESGKSTLLKNFQLQYTPEAFRAESDAWRTVIQLNLVRSVNVVLGLLTRTTAGAAPPSQRLSQSKDDLRWLKMRLAPLRQVELIYNKLLGVDIDPDFGGMAKPDEQEWDSGKLSEVSLRSNFGWQTLVGSNKERPGSRFWDELDNAQRILAACREDILAMCENPTVQDTLKEQGIALLDEPGFFFDQADRIATIPYEPTPEDILRARLRTVGVEEHRLVMESPPMEKGREWVFYDVGGDRGQRATWAPYFDDVNAIMFLCPMSGFDQVLSEDRAVNRLIDSMKLWKIICTSKLLENATFILFLNKCDILKSKLESGVRFCDHIEQYKSQPNDYENVTSYIKKIFLAIHKDHSPKKRKVHVHTTCATDTEMMSTVLNSIRDVILLNVLETTNLIA